MKRRRLRDGERPAGVADAVEDHLPMKTTMTHYGVVAGSGTAFWGWLAGSGLTHVWTSREMVDIETKLGTVDAVLFDRAYP